MNSAIDRAQTQPVLRETGQAHTGAQTYRLAEGGVIERSRALEFRFDGKTYSGCEGDTLASALLANGVRLVGRSFKYHRPRGIYSAGSEEPNALVELRSGNRLEPNTRATQIELYDGLIAHSQNRWPNLVFDIASVNDWLSPLLPAGFYYKTFMWPASFWENYEYFIRRAAGLGRASREPDPDRYDMRSIHCETLIVGGGVAGLAAAKAAAERGERVVVVDENPRFGGRLWKEHGETVDARPGSDWLADTLAKLQAIPDVRLLTRTTAFGYYDHNFVAAVERVQDHVGEPAAFVPRQRLWKIRAGRVVIASGAIEQPVVFADNDRPGVMLASAARAYINAYGVLPGRRAALLTNNDDAYRTALDLWRVGAEVAAVCDMRADPQGELVSQVRDAGIPVLAAHGIVAVRGARAVKGVQIMPLAGGGKQRLDCDLICVSAGWAPAVHLYSQSGGKLAYLPSLGAFGPGEAKQRSTAVGAAAGEHLPPCGPVRAVAAAPGRKRKRFIDIQNDVTADDVALAEREGYRSVEHLKRYTTLGMGTDQGKTSNLSGLTQMAELRDRPIPDVGITTFRPPYVAVSLGVLAGRDVGAHFQPLRRTPMDGWHAENGARWIDAGLWRRPHYYPQGSETVDEASRREVLATRNGVGLCDVTTLGKIDVQGPDAAEFLNRVYVNGWKSLPIGKARYGLMLREDGIVYDDGTTSRLGEQHYLMTTTTGNAARVLAALEFYLQAVWPELRVQVASVTEQWAGASIAGPKARQVLAKLVDIDISNGAFPFMAVAECTVAGVAARLFRISFSGELAYEVNVAADYGMALWEALLEAGREHGIVVYGMESLGAMRIEKGHVAGPELNGNTHLGDLGLARLASRKKHYIGRALMERAALTEPHRQALVGLLPADGKTWIKAGSQLVAAADSPPPAEMLGYVTSIAYSPELGTPIALALLAGGLQREGETLYAVFPLKNEVVEVRVTSPHFVDPQGERQYA